MSAGVTVDGVAWDYHHILYQQKVWSIGWARELRRHKYCGMYIPQDTLHKTIHAKVMSIPLPDGVACKNAVIALDSWLYSDYITMKDSLERRLQVIASCFRAEFPETAAALDEQLKIVSEFYKNGG